ncbi:MAG TPA: NAD(P)/FAD-dependent oxidoreductase [Woeseiaceae bacterium]|nr:NAD(P)/FAD-dependent oxidoreductase [Woeseiaceae bacterium]
MKDYDVAIVGGGPAGLSAALVLARARRKIAIIDAGTPRNNVSPGVHAFLSRDGISPADLKKVSRKQISRYPDVAFVDQSVRHIRAANPRRGFGIALDGGDTLRVQAVVLAVGMIDELPDLPDFDRYWGRQIIHCPFCHGYENAGTRWGVLANDLDDVEKSENYRFWTDTLRVFVDQRLHIPDEMLGRLDSLDIAVDRRTIRRLIASDDGRLSALGMSDGSQVACDTIVYRPRQRQTAVVNDSRVALSEFGRVWIDKNQQTSIRGIFAAGDLTPGCQDALAAAAEGAKAAKSALDSLRS